MSDFTYRELDDLDSAIGDSAWMVEDDWHGTGGMPDETKDYLRRLEKLRDKVSQMMSNYPRPSTDPSHISESGK